VLPEIHLRHLTHKYYICTCLKEEIMIFCLPLSSTEIYKSTEE
jgi:hypothetical protein